MSLAKYDAADNINLDKIFRDVEEHHLSKFGSRWGLADIARHVIDTHFKPSFLKCNGILRRGEQHLPDPTRFLQSAMASYDVASSICQTLVSYKVQWHPMT